MQVSKAPVADDSTQHWVDPGQPSGPHASQQLVLVPTHAFPPGGALQLAALCLMLHRVLPAASVRQQVT